MNNFFEIFLAVLSALLAYNAIRELIDLAKVYYQYYLKRDSENVVYPTLPDMPLINLQDISDKYIISICHGGRSYSVDNERGKNIVNGYIKFIDLDGVYHSLPSLLCHVNFK